MITTVSAGPVELSVSIRTGPEPGCLVLVHATGFCKELWQPVLEHLPQVTAVAFDQRGHGGSTIGPPPYDWWDLAHDSLAVIKDVGTQEPVIGIGHSSGAAALSMAEVLAPGTFDALVLVEPIVYPGPFGRTDGHPLTVSALRRRSRFDSTDQALAWFTERGAFAEWTADALRAYSLSGIREEDDGSWGLACRPEVEAEFYRGATAHGVWDRLAEVACPVTVVVGERSDSHPRPFAESLIAQYPNARLVTVSDATHFVPMEQPVALAATIEAAYRSMS